MNADFRVEPADYRVDFADLRAVREPVFVVEQQVPIEEEWDELDPQCRHVIARDNNNTPIGTGRLTPERKIGRMAVVATWRGKGVGGALLEALMDEARALGWPEVTLNSQTHAMPFYAAYGFEAFGDEFMEAGIPHRKMRKALNAPDPGRRPRPAPQGDAAIIEVDSETAVRDTALKVLSRARREIRVFTRDLEPGLYGFVAVVEALRAFATSGRAPMVHIIVIEPERLRAEGHALLALTQRLPSVFRLRTPIDPEDRQAAEGFIVADETAYLFRPLATRFEGGACLDGPARASQLAQEFDRRWERARELTEVRAIGI